MVLQLIFVKFLNDTVIFQVICYKIQSLIALVGIGDEKGS